MSRRRLTWILGALSAIGPLSIDTAAPAFPEIARSLGATVAAVQLTLSAYLAGIVAGQLVHGPLSDRLGRRPPLLAGLAVYTLASGVGALAPTLPILWGARFAQGLGVCAVIVVSRAVVRDRCGERDAAELHSARMLVSGLAPIVAPLLGGHLVAALGWRAVFVVLALSGLALALVAAAALPESLSGGPAGAGLGAVLRDATDAVRDRRFVRLALAGGASEAALFACISGAPFAFMQGYGVTPERFGLIGAGNAAGVLAGLIVGRKLVRALGVSRALRAGAGAAVIAYATLAAAVHLGAGAGVVVPLMIAGVSTVGIVLPSATAAAMDLRGERAGSASAVLGLLQSGSGVLASGAVSLLADGSPRPMALVMLGFGTIASLLLYGGEARSHAPTAVLTGALRGDPADRAA